MPEWTPEQRKILDADGSVLVSASAGSGKTTVMVRKIVDRILSGTPVGRILVVSYTEASAADMREKIIRALYDEASAENLDKKSLDFLRGQLDSLAFADIGTLDAFCARLIRRNFELLDVSPNFRQMDEVEAAELKKSVIDGIIADRYERQDEGFLKTVSRMASFVNDRRIPEVVLKTYDALRYNLDPDEFKKTLSLSSSTDPDGLYGKTILLFYREKAADMIPFYKNALDSRDFSAVPAYAEAAAKCLKIAGDLACAGCAADVRNLEELPAFDGQEDRAHRVSTEDKNALIEVRKSLKGIIDKLNKELFIDTAGFDTDGVNKFIGEVMALVDEFAKAYEAEKIRGNRLDFSDLSHLTIRLLSDPEKAGKISAAYSYVFVDEYQDINRLHHKILELASAGNMFRVGDVKQSIYAFRNAEPGIFLRDWRDFAENGGGSALPMSTNFRSTGSILDFCNEVFSALMTENHGGLVYDSEGQRFRGGPSAGRGEPVRIVFRRPTGDRPAVDFRGVYSVAGHPAGDEAGESYAEGVSAARVMKELVREGYAYGDMAVLFSKRTSTEGYLKALSDADIPFISEGFIKNSGIKYKNQLINVLRVLDNARNDIPMAGFLLSYFGGFSEKELAEIRLKDTGTLLYENLRTASADGDSLGAKCSAALDFVRRWRYLSAFMTVDELLNTLINETGFDAYAAADCRSPDGMSDVSAFIDRISGSPAGKEIGDFLSFYDNLSERDRETSLTSFGDAVKISTVHGSKGLEYKVVFVSSAQSPGFGGNDSSDMLFDKDLGIGMILYNEQTRAKINSLAYNAINCSRTRRQTEERIRLLYVALTRAKERLYITGTLEKKDDPKAAVFIPKPVSDCVSFKDLLFRAAAGDARVLEHMEEDDAPVPELPSRADQPALFGEPEQVYLEETERVTSFSYAYAPATRVSNKYTVSELNDFAGEDSPVSVPAVVRESPDRRRRGIAYHTVMEHVPLTCVTKSEAELFISSLVERGVLSEEDAALVNPEDISKCLSDPVIREGTKGRYLRERPFMLRARACDVLDTDVRDRILVQGAADLILLGEENAVIDFKCSSLPDDRLAERYGRQLELYAKAAEAALGIRIDRKLLYSFGTGRFIPVP